MATTSTKTTKSFKTEKRDKPKHSVKAGGKKGGKGSGDWKDDIKFDGEDIHAMDNEDPNFDPVDPTEGKVTFSTWKPTEEHTTEFHKSVSNLREFKDKVRMACAEYVVSNDIEEFKRCVTELKSPIYHQDIPAIVIKHCLDMSEAEQNKVSQLLQQLGKKGFLSDNQMTQGFRKLLNSMDDMTIDNPAAKGIVSEMMGAINAAGCLGDEAAEMEKNFLVLVDPEAAAQLAAGKKRITQEVNDYFSAEDVSDFRVSVLRVSPAIHFEVVKIVVSTALDRGDRQRECASKALAALSSDVIPIAEVEKGFTVLLSRLEDLILDVPDVFRLLSCFIARAVADEALSPAFLVRVDLAETDMGSKVLEQASILVKQPKAAMHLSGVWGFFEEDEEETEK